LGRQRPIGALPFVLCGGNTDETLGYRFKDARLLDTALTHGSYVHEHPDLDIADLERLEFLGDAVVDLVVAEELFQRFPDAAEGELTTLRARVVSRDALAAVATRLGLPDRARLGVGEEASGGRTRAGLGASLFESVIGAIYLEAGFEVARDALLRALHDELAATATAPRKSAKSQLQERAQAEIHELPVYRVVEERGPEHRRDFVVEVEIPGHVAQGSGSSKREAEEVAASRLLEEAGWV
jgi:ribonuclease-3